MQPIERKKQLIKASILRDCGDNPLDPRCVRAFKLVDAMADANIPAGYWMLKMESFKGPKPLQVAVLKYMEEISTNYESGRSLCFAGNQGTGKTMSAICILKEALKRDYTAYYTTASDLMAELTSGYKMQTRTTLREAEFLAIDEVDSRFFPSDAQKELFSGLYENVFRYRAHNLLPTIICTNETEGLRSVFYGQSIHSIESLHSQYLDTYFAAGKDYRRTQV